MIVRLALLCALLMANLPVLADSMDPLIDRVANRNGIDPILLRAIAAKESSKRPWTFNADGEGFHFGSKPQAVGALWSLTKAPWLVKVLPPEGGKPLRRFFPSARAAEAFLSSYQRGRTANGQPLVHVRRDQSKDVAKGQARVRQVWLLNTDIGIAQISYRFHGQNKATVQKWFDPEFNLTYAASHLAALKQKHGSDIAAAGYYHSKTPSLRAAYLRAFKKVYAREQKKAAGAVVASK